MNRIIKAMLVCTAVGIAACASESRSIKELTEYFRQFYEEGRTEELLGLVYGFPDIEYRETIEWLFTFGAGDLKIQSLEIRPHDADPPEGFGPFETTMEGVEFNLDYQYLFYAHAVNEGDEWRLAWPVAEHGRHWYFAGLRKE